MRSSLFRGSSMAERGTVNPQVAGSNPARGAIRLTSFAHGFQPGRRNLVECPERGA